jgi:hypothetical protein
MGYDIFSMREDREKAIAYDQKWGNTFRFDKDTGEYTRSGSTVYFRANIWGMAIIREVHSALGMSDLNDALYDNSGTVIRDWECEKYADHLDAKSDDEIKAALLEVLVATSPELANDPDEVSAWVKEIRAWADFLRVCADLKGCEVC